MQNFGDLRSTQDCAFYVRGTCTKGSQCPFRHNTVRASHAAEAPSALGGKGGGQVDSQQPCCSTRLPPQAAITQMRQQQSTQDCLYFLSGRCTKGSLCAFRHDEVRGRRGARGPGACWWRRRPC